MPPRETCGRPEDLPRGLTDSGRLAADRQCNIPSCGSVGMYQDAAHLRALGGPGHLTAHLSRMPVVTPPIDR